MVVGQRGDSNYLPGLTVSSRDDVSVRDEHAPALVLGEEAEPGGFSHEHLPGKLAERSARTAHYTAFFRYMRTNAAF